MLRIDAKEHLSHPAERVFATLRDKTPELVVHLPNIESVEVLNRRDEPPRTHLINRWQAKNDDVPSILRPFVKKELLSWIDRAAWDAEKLSCDWEIEAVAGRDCFSCQGSTQIAPDGEGRALFTLHGELRVDPDHVPGVPRFLARRIQEPLEHFIAAAMRPNLASIAIAVQRYLDALR